MLPMLAYAVGVVITVTLLTMVAVELRRLNRWLDVAELEADDDHG